jgi:hypothetical protein
MQGMARALLLAVAVSAAVGCRSWPRSAVDSQVVWECAADPSGMAGTIRDWARRVIKGTDEASAMARRTAHLTEVSADSVRIVDNQADCAKAGRAYLERDRPTPGTHPVALVSVGEHYIAIDLAQVSRSGEFRNSALLDRRFRTVLWMIGGI